MLGRIRIRSGGEHDHRRWEQNFYCLQNSLLFSGSRLCRFCVTWYDCGMRAPGFMLPLSESVLPVSANSSEKISPVSGSCVFPDISFGQLKIVNIDETGRQKPSPPITIFFFLTELHLVSSFFTPLSWLSGPLLSYLQAFPAQMSPLVR